MHPKLIMDSGTGLDALMGRTLVLVAHPDDETVGCGALLQRIGEPIVVFCTDGAPKDEYFWKRYGSRLQYARTRQQEARAALALAGVGEAISAAEQAGAGKLCIDQELHRAIAPCVEFVGGVIRRLRPSALLTLTYEGGHPDHDTCSFVASILGSRHRLPVWEFPLYHRAEGRMQYQQFVVPDAGDLRLEITPEELEIKTQMLQAYRSQHPFLLDFNPTVERFRRQPAYDYSRPPHAGVLNYEAWQWPVTGSEVCAAVARFRQQESAA